MKHTITVALRPETVSAHNSITLGTQAEASVNLGANNGEPLLVIMDGLLAYAQDHQAQFGSKLADDYFLGPEWLSAATGIRSLLNGNGAIANRFNKSTDSKDNGALESVFWCAMDAAGFTEGDI
jgi:hypothetical protein